MSEKETLFRMALIIVRLLELCTMAQPRKAISKKEYADIKGLVQEIHELAETLP